MVIKPVNVLKMGPKRDLTYDKGRDVYVLTVTPPEFLGIPPSSVTLTSDQVTRYHKWRTNGGLIQDELPDLTPAERDIILTGISD